MRKKSSIKGTLETAIVFVKLNGKWVEMNASDEVFNQMIAYAQTISEKGTLLMNSLPPEMESVLAEHKQGHQGEKRGLSVFDSPKGLQ